MLAEQITTAIAATDTTAKAGASEEEAAARAARVQRVLEQLDLGDWDTLAETTRQVLGKMAQGGAAAGAAQIRVNLSDDLTNQVNEDALAWAKARSAELVGMQYNDDGELVENPNAQWSIAESTREMLRSDVTVAIDEGLSTDDLAAALEARYAFSADRAQTIARTELAKADVQGNMIAYAASGVVSGKEWVLGSEHTDDDECDDAAAMGVVPLDSDFGGIGDPPAHPNCVCDVLPVLAEDGGG